MDQRSALESLTDIIRKKKIDKLLFASAVIVLVIALLYSLFATLKYTSDTTFHYITEDEITWKRTTNFTKGIVGPAPDVPVCDANACLNRSTAIQAQQRLLIENSAMLPFICTSMLKVPMSHEIPWFCTIIRRSDNATLYGRQFTFTMRHVIQFDYTIHIPYFGKMFNGSAPKRVRVYSSQSLTPLDLVDVDSIYFNLLTEILGRGKP